MSCLKTMFDLSGKVEHLVSYCTLCGTTEKTNTPRACAI